MSDEWMEQWARLEAKVGEPGWNGVVVVSAADLRAALARVDALERHYDAAGPEHNLLALLDLYLERALKAEWERGELALELNTMQTEDK